MATAVTSPTVDTTNTVDIKTSNETYRVYVKLDADSKKITEVKMGSAGKDNAFWAKMDADPEWHKGFEQTAKIYKAGSLAGISLLVPDATEAVNVFNRGASQKSSQKLTAEFTKLTDDETGLAFDPIEGAFDTIELLNEPTSRRNLTPQDKALNALRLAVQAMNPGLEGEELEDKVNQFFASLQS
jgi:hypothetical protein